MKDTLLRPRSAVEIIDAAFALYRAHFAVVAVLSLALLGPFEVIGAVIGGTIGGVISNLSGLFTPIVVGATVAVVSDAMHGRPITVGSAFGQVAGRWGTLVLVSFVQGLLVFLGLIFLLVPGVLAFVWTFAAPMAIVVERATGVSAAIERSRELTRGQFWHVLGTLVLAWIVVVVLLIALGIGLGIMGRLIGISDDMINFLASWAFILMIPIAALASSILYFDLRVRTEAYDIEQLAQTIDSGDAARTV
jgi:hypothetical protein